MGSEASGESGGGCRDGCRADLLGMGGNDSLTGAAGNDSLSGGTGTDTLNGGADDDWMDSGAGNDRFMFAAAFGDDTIASFDANAAGGQDLLNGKTPQIPLLFFAKTSAIVRLR